jgi:hypothetical protein
MTMNGVGKDLTGSNRGMFQATATAFGWEN